MCCVLDNVSSGAVFTPATSFAACPYLLQTSDIAMDIPVDSVH